MANKIALILLDVQVGFLEGEAPVYKANAMLERLQTLVNCAQSAGIMVVFIQHAAQPTVDGPLHPVFKAIRRDVLIRKLTPDAFYGTTLQTTLQSRGVDRLVLAGFQTEMCIDTTCRRAWSMGYNVTLVQDAHSTFSLEGATLAAPQIINHHNTILSEFATLKPTAEVMF